MENPFTETITTNTGEILLALATASVCVGAGVALVSLIFGLSRAIR